jgi:hypothetical protein
MVLRAFYFNPPFAHAQKIGENDPICKQHFLKCFSQRCNVFAAKQNSIAVMT